MKNRSEALQKAEMLIRPLAMQHVPNKSDVEAVVDQWLHALATDSDLFVNAEIVEQAKVKKMVKEILEKEGVFISKEDFFNEVFGGLKIKPLANAKFRFIDLFAGIGGVRLGFQGVGGVCVFSSEFDVHAQKTYSANHGEMPFGDITEISPSNIPNHDILLAGFPCQPFSHAGLKLGIDDIRGTLFHNIADILEIKKPRFALLENVKGLISHDKGHTLKVILRALTRIGYSCKIPKSVIEHGSTKEIQDLAKAMVLKSVDFGVPQNRQRIYIVLWRDGERVNFKYPTPAFVSTRVGDILEKSPNDKLTISDRLWEGHQRRKIENERNGKGFGYGLFTPESQYTNTISARYYKDGSEILISQKNKNPRKISVREAARLQGFPDSFEPNASTVQAYKQFGNSVTVSVVAAVANEIVKLMENKNVRAK